MLTGHSYAGTVIGAAALRAPDRVRHVVHLDTALPVSRRSHLDLAGPELAAYVEAHARDGRWPWPGREALPQYHGDLGFTAEDWDWLDAHAAGHPIASIAEPAPPGVEDHGVPRTYVTCTRAAAPSPVAPGTPGWTLEAIDANHWPMVTHPAELATILAGV